MKTTKNFLLIPAALLAAVRLPALAQTSMNTMKHHPMMRHSMTMHHPMMHKKSMTMSHAPMTGKMHRKGAPITPGTNTPGAPM